ncbi:DUF5681 domain-containing protein [Bradyrhizobium yuanmingense]|uniref:DUF5681 domain-containing protein n=1 Tax=Bradyrhizobium yuanmingense TaxID=108015 RepID=UPI0023B9C8EF|nr:DUF5681 domain-containing protein [Bradyrhizobium yuanmingense]MDF0497971.1 DUF5681 domain-containing protein [Bradyrhizobium yuanmingense]
MQGRFKKGQSGNPSGKRKPRNSSNRKSISIEAALYHELQQEITVSEGDKTYTITKLGALAKQAVTSALDKGELRLLKTLLSLQPVVDGALQAIEASDQEGVEARARVTEKLNKISERLLGRKLND